MIRFVVSSLKVALIVISTVAVALGGFQLFDHYQSQAEESAGVGEPVVITISKKDSTEDVAEKLRKKGLIRSEAVFELTVRYVDRNIRPATYELKKGMSVSNIVDAITTAKSKAVTKVKDYNYVTATCGNDNANGGREYDFRGHWVYDDGTTDVDTFKQKCSNETVPDPVP